MNYTNCSNAYKIFDVYKCNLYPIYNNNYKNLTLVDICKIFFITLSFKYYTIFNNFIIFFKKKI